MTIYQLIQINPLQKLSKYPDESKGYPGTLKLQEGRMPPTLDAGYKYVPVEETPTYNSETQKVVPLLTEEKNGWRVVDLSQEEIREKRIAPFREIEAWQAKAALMAQGRLDDVQQAIDALPEGIQKIKIKAMWDHNAIFRIDSPNITAMAELVGFTNDEVEALFQFGASLVDE